MKKSTEKLFTFVFGVIFVVVLLIIAIKFPEPTPFQYTIFRITLALAAAGVATMLTGFIDINISNIVKASGALAVFVLVYFYNPAQTVITEKHLNDETMRSSINSHSSETPDVEKTRSGRVIDGSPIDGKPIGIRN